MKKKNENKDVLVTRDQNGKIRVIHISLKWNDSLHAFIIDRQAGIYKGKMLQHPLITIDKGKVKRTVEEQALLQYNSIIKKYLDKGYKLLNELSDGKDLEEIVPKQVTDQSGILKPMLAKSSEGISSKILDRNAFWFASTKIDGVRCLIYYKDGKIQTRSRGGENYDNAVQDFINHPKLIEFFKVNSSIILDGELYVWKRSLQEISGCVRREKNTPTFKLQYYLFDVIINKPFKERLKTLDKIEQELGLSKFDPEREYLENDLRIQVVPHIPVSKWKNILNLHDKWVSDGWEGLVIRDPEKTYIPGGRSNAMIKVKRRQDDTFVVVGYELGLRGIEDMCFIMQMKDGRTFKAKPMGDRNLKENYFKNITKLIGQKADCTFFYYSDDGIPLQPVFKAFRYDV